MASIYCANCFSLRFFAIMPYISSTRMTAASAAASSYILKNSAAAPKITRNTKYTLLPASANFFIFLFTDCTSCNRDSSQIITWFLSPAVQMPTRTLSYYNIIPNMVHLYNK